LENIQAVNISDTDYIKELAFKYQDLNQKKQEYDKQRKEVRDVIKNTMSEKGIKEFDDSEINIKIIENERKKVDEEALLEIIEKHNLDAVKTAPDLTKLEKIVESGELSQDVIQEISDCIKVTKYEYIKTKEKGDD